MKFMVLCIGIKMGTPVNKPANQLQVPKQITKNRGGSHYLLIQIFKLGWLDF